MGGGRLSNFPVKTSSSTPVKKKFGWIVVQLVLETIVIG